jgi:RimJ/RimL family protein N-acetyltransferase
MKTLETARLRLRPRTLADLDAIIAMDSDADVRRYIGGPLEPVAHRAEVQRNIAQGRPAPYFAWAIEWKDQPGFLGQCALNRSPRPGVTEISWRLMKANWGRGICSEAAVAVLDHAIRDLRLRPTVALIHPRNKASARVAQKIGLQLAGETLFKGAIHQVYLSV